MATKYGYEVSDPAWFPNDKVNLDALEQEVKAKIATGDIVGALDHIDLYHKPPPDDLCDIWFVDPLDAASQAELDAVCAAHQGDPPLQVRYHATATLAEEKVILTTNDWGYLASAVTSPDFFMDDLTRFIGRVNGCCKTVGTGVELRVVEDDASKVMGTFPMPDTADEWEQLNFYSTALPSAGQHEYILEGRLDGATSAEVRGMSMSILENITPPEL